MTRDARPYLLAVLLAAGAAAWLRWVGQGWVAPSGRVLLWHGAVLGPETSKHLLDWWSPAHAMKGALLYAGLWLWARPVPLPWRFAVAVAVGAAWEVAENTEALIARYRAVGVAPGYTGDSVVNALADLGVMSGGFWLARLLPVPATAALVLAFEALTTATVRDGLVLNVLMLLWPVEAVRAWQAGA